MDQNTGTKFGAKIATFLANGDPSAAAAYSQQPQAINSAIEAVSQQLQKTQNADADIENQFTEKWLWPLLASKSQINPPAMKPQAGVNPLEGAASGN